MLYGGATPGDYGSAPGTPPVGSPAPYPSAAAAAAVAAVAGQGRGGQGLTNQLDDAINVLRNHVDFQGLPPMSASAVVPGANGNYGLDDLSTDAPYQVPHQSDATSPPPGATMSTGKKRKATASATASDPGEDLKPSSSGGKSKH